MTRQLLMSASADLPAIFRLADNCDVMVLAGKAALGGKRRFADKASCRISTCALSASWNKGEENSNFDFGWRFRRRSVDRVVFFAGVADWTIETGGKPPNGPKRWGRLQGLRYLHSGRATRLLSSNLV